MNVFGCDEGHALGVPIVHARREGVVCISVVMTHMSSDTLGAFSRSILCEV